MGCTHTQIQLFDFLYGGISDKEVRSFERHLADCAACRAEILQCKDLFTALEQSEGDYKSVHSIELDECGMPTEYNWAAMINRTEKTRTMTGGTINKDFCIEYAMYQHEEVQLQLLPYSPTQYRYIAHLPHPVAPGEVEETLQVFHPEGPNGWAERLDNECWHFRYEASPNTGLEWVFLLMLRLPAGAKLLKANPPTTAADTHGEHTNLSWRTLLPVLDRSRSEQRFQFTCDIEYSYVPPTGKRAGKPARRGNRPAVVLPPENLLAIDRLPVIGSGPLALEVYRQVIDTEMTDHPTLFHLGMALYDGGYYAEALDVFTRTAAIPTPAAAFHWGAVVWQGMLLDLMSRCEEALQRYREAQEFAGGEDFAIQHSLFQLMLTGQWVEERLEAPYSRTRPIDKSNPE